MHLIILIVLFGVVHTADAQTAAGLRRDNGNILGNENFTFVIDTFHDRRNGYLFQTNPLGALRDMTVTDDQQNSAWNGIWYVKTGRFENGWTMEVSIPFKSLRYRGSGPQTWGINLRRLVKWKNEFSYLSLVPAALGTGGVSRMASAATVVGLETPAESKNLELKPYAVSSLGGYTSSTNRVSYSLGQQRKVSGRVSAATGTLYDGTRSEVAYSGRWGVAPQFSVEPSMTLAWVQLPDGDFTARLISSRFTVTPSARMLISSLVQFNVDAKNVSASVRLRWEYTGGSELFVVYSDGRDTRTPRFPGLLNRTFAIKATRLVRF